MLRILASVAALALTTPAAADEYSWRDDYWSVTSDTLHDGTPFCTLMGSYVNDDFLGIHFVPTKNIASLSLILPMAKAANFSPSVSHEMEIRFVIGDSVDDGWGDRTFGVSDSDEGDSRIFTSKNMEAEVLMSDFARANTIAFTMYDGERIVAVFNLSGTATPIAKLRECGYSRVVR
jgi:hypothetical protein